MSVVSSYDNANVSIKQHNTQRVILQSGGVAAIMRAMEANPNAKDVQHYACFVFDELLKVKTNMVCIVIVCVCVCVCMCECVCV